MLIIHEPGGGPRGPALRIQEQGRINVVSKHFFVRKINIHVVKFWNDSKQFSLKSLHDHILCPRLKSYRPLRSKKENESSLYAQYYVSDFQNIL